MVCFSLTVVRRYSEHFPSTDCKSSQTKTKVLGGLGTIACFLAVLLSVIKWLPAYDSPVNYSPPKGPAANSPAQIL